MALGAGRKISRGWRVSVINGGGGESSRVVGKVSQRRRHCSGDGRHESRNWTREQHSRPRGQLLQGPEATARRWSGPPIPQYSLQGGFTPGSSTRALQGTLEVALPTLVGSSPGADVWKSDFWVTGLVWLQWQESPSEVLLQHCPLSSPAQCLLLREPDSSFPNH